MQHRKERKKLNSNCNKFPFSAIVGQESIKKSLLWNIVNPKIGGVLISGEKGTAKSTLVRSLCDLIFTMELIEIPLNTTEDRLMGGIHLERTLKYGKRSFEPGILQRANNNILYVDEVNLLSDPIVKNLLEAASSGLNKVEREGLSLVHDSKFILVGSMNPEEGGIRPQFLDRFGLFVEANSENDIRKRTEIIKRRIYYENNPYEFFKSYQKQNQTIKTHIAQAQNALRQLVVTEHAMKIASAIAMEANCAGHRAELILIETAKAIAAWDFRKTLNISDIKEAAKFVLPHRTRQRQDPQAPNIHQDTHDDDNVQASPDSQENNSPPEELPTQDSSIPQQENSLNDSDEIEPDKIEPEENQFSNDSDKTEESGEIFDVGRWLSEKKRKSIHKGSGKRSVVKTDAQQGRHVRSRIPATGNVSNIAIAATLRAAAPYQLFREKNDLAFCVKKSDIRVKIREKRTGNTILFVVDASGSMGAENRMRSVKGAILSLLNDAYQKRDRVGLIAFRRNSAELLLGITRSVELAQKELQSLPTGGRTPLDAGLDLAYEIIKSAKIKDKDILPVIVLVSDGKATYSEKSKDSFESAIDSARRIGAEKIKTVIIDADQGFIKLHFLEKLAEAMNADLLEINDLHSKTLTAAVKMSL
ncbi:VWA domain-containing protein [Alkalibacter mobilis]|uniref:VWA domain-containing protein n=1 Tax=Alkalibacter mobilis TaxID=2787712 RepID=UPI0018A0B12E|nr:VWA domain-containing protein [Alkalibacter mobilis]MBF7095652.1 VWA domain-containing protein [Alkalibacter mobilis]